MAHNKLLLLSLLLALASGPAALAQPAGTDIGVLATSDATGAVRLFWTVPGSGADWPAGGFRVERFGAGEAGEPEVLVPALQPGTVTAAVALLEDEELAFLEELQTRLGEPAPSEERRMVILQVVLYSLQSYDLARAAAIGYLDSAPPRATSLVYRVSALSADGRVFAQGQSLPIRSGQEAPLPPAPVDVRVEVHREGVALWWERAPQPIPGGPSATLFRVKRSQVAAGRGEPLGDGFVLPPPRPPEGEPQPPWFVDAEPPPERQVYYTVVSIDPFGRESEPSPPVRVLSPDWTALTPPVDIEAEVVAGRVHLSWPAPESPYRKGFKVVRAFNPRARGEVLTPEPVPEPRFVDGSAKAGTAYYYRVSSVNLRDEEGEPSQAKGVKVLGSAPPPPPGDLRAELGSGRVVLHWRPPAGETVAAYRVERAVGADGDRWAILTTTLHSAPRFEDLYPRETEGVFRYRVRSIAFDEQVSEPSLALTVPLPDFHPPLPPIITGIDGRDGRVTLTFTPAGKPGDEAGFFVLRSHRGLEPGFVVNEEPLPAGARSFVDAEVEAGQTLYYRIVAVDAAGNRSRPNQDPVAVRVRAPELTAPPTPRARFEAEPYPRVVVEFDPPADASTRYVLERLDPNGLWRVIQGPVPRDETRMLDTRPPAGSKASYRLLAVATDGLPGPASPAVEVEIP